MKVQEEFGTFDAYIWKFVGGRPKQNVWKKHERLPAKTASGRVARPPTTKRDAEVLSAQLDGQRKIGMNARGNDDRKLALTHNLGGYPGEMVSFVSILGTERD